MKEKDKAEKLNCGILISVTEDDKEAIKVIAKENRETVANFCRIAILNRARIISND